MNPATDDHTAITSTVAELLQRPAGRHAYAVATATYPGWLLDHCLRSLSLAIALADAHQLEPDRDALAIAVLLHDLALVPLHHDTTTRFEVRSADLAHDHAKQAGLDNSRAELVWDAVALHGTGGISEHKHPTAHATYLGIAADVTGAGLDLLEPTAVASIMNTRADFAAHFLDAIRNELEDKPVVGAFNWMSDLTTPPGGGLPPFPALVFNQPWEHRHPETSMAHAAQIASAPTCTPSSGYDVVANLARTWPFMLRLGAQLVDVEADRALVRLPYAPHNTTVDTMLHGGAIAALIDVASTLAAWATDQLPDAVRGVTVSLAINYLAPAHAAAVTAESRVRRRGRQLCAIDTDITTTEGQLVATAQATYKIG